MAVKESPIYVESKCPTCQRHTDHSSVPFYIFVAFFFALCLGTMYVYVQWLLADQRAFICEKRTDTPQPTLSEKERKTKWIHGDGHRKETSIDLLPFSFMALVLNTCVRPAYVLGTYTDETSKQQVSVYETPYDGPLQTKFMNDVDTAWAAVDNSDLKDQCGEYILESGKNYTGLSEVRHCAEQAMNLPKYMDVLGCRTCTEIVGPMAWILAGASAGVKGTVYRMPTGAEMHAALSLGQEAFDVKYRQAAPAAGIAAWKDLPVPSGDEPSCHRGNVLKDVCFNPDLTSYSLTVTEPSIPPKSPSSNKTLVIVLSVVGGVVGLALLLGGAYWWRMRRMINMPLKTAENIMMNGEQGAVQMTNMALRSGEGAVMDAERAAGNMMGAVGSQVNATGNVAAELVKDAEYNLDEIGSDVDAWLANLSSGSAQKIRN